MPTAYVLINCDLGSEEEILKELRRLNEVVELSGVYGVYDIIVKMTGTSPNDLEYAYSKIRHIDGIKTTSTLVAYTKYEF